MISCTEFIPAYNELFKYLDENFGRPEIETFWTYLFAPTGKGIPLINFLKKDGLRGAWDYWKGTLTEEAADVVKYMNEEEGWIYSHMRYCPSKGRLLELQKEIGLEPYYDYCGHCDYYRAAIEQVGLCWIRDHIDTDTAQCRSILYDPKVFKGIMKLNDATETLVVDPKEAEYFHPDFHSSMNMGIDYIGRVHGFDHLKKYLELYTERVYKPVIEEMKTAGALTAIENKIRETYKLEKAEDLVSIENDGKTLTVKVESCPAVTHLHKTGREVSEFFGYTTEIVMATLAKIGGVKFTMVAYDAATGKSEYKFEA